ncbi:MAG: ABC transporter permease [Alcanivoracaceae bacterium]|jgi:phosphonate transport system permease protein|nr:ABC transporter permease [Alcanivoracaceae bacterium]
MNTTASRLRHTTLILAVLGLLALLLADISITTRDPGIELAHIGNGFLTPDFFSTEKLWQALGYTLAFALQGVAVGSAGGFLLALLWRWRAVRAASAIVRAIHELFWGLLFLQVFGLSTLTGLLAIAVPYCGIFAKVFGEFLEESDRAPARALPTGSDAFSSFWFARLPLVWQHMKTYGAYRVECAVRSSAILGFIGLPTIGFHLETAFRQGEYSTGAALLYIFLVVILSLRLWLRPVLLPLWLFATLLWAPPQASVTSGRLIRFLSEDIVPAPLRQSQWQWSELADWLLKLLQEQILPGVGQTLVLGMAALLATGILALMLFPLISSQFGHRLSRGAGHSLLVLLRTLPEFLLAFVFVLVLGPSMLPGILALALHTGAIVAHLCGRFTDTLNLRVDAANGLNRYAFEVLPRIYPNFLAFLLYRWEIIMRETAILGVLGITTLGFYIDSAFSELRTDRALVLIGAGVMLNIAVDAISRGLRQRLRLRHGLTDQN